MNTDLETIANLKYGKAIERISREAQEKMRLALTSMPRGGHAEHAKLQIRLDQSEQSCREYARIWQDLLEQRNGGHLTRADVDFIMGKVREVVAARTSSLFHPQAPNGMSS